MFAKKYKKTTKKDIIKWKLGVDKCKSFVPCVFVLTSENWISTDNNAQNDEEYVKSKLIK